MRLIRLIVLLFAVAAMAMAQSGSQFKNFYPDPGNPQSVVYGTTTTGASTAYYNPTTCSQVFVVQMVLVGGTSATGQVEGSVDGTNYETMMLTPFSLTAGQHNSLVLQAPYRFIRFNTLTNVGGGTVIALMSW